MIFAARMPHLMNGWDGQPPPFSSFVKNDVGSQGMVVPMNHDIVYISAVHEEYPTSWKAEMTIHDPMIRVVYTQLILWRAYTGVVPMKLCDGPTIHVPTVAALVQDTCFSLAYFGEGPS